MSEEINLATLEIMDALQGFLGTRENIYLFHGNKDFLFYYCQGTRIIFIINGNSLRQFLKKQLRHKDEHFDHSPPATTYPSPKVLNRVNGGVDRKVSFRLASVV